MSNPIESSLAQCPAPYPTLPSHPLENQDLLEIIMRYLSHKDVASFARAHIAETYRCQDITHLIRKLKDKASVFSAAAKTFQIWNQAKTLYEARFLFFRNDEAIRNRAQEYYVDKYHSSLTPLALSLEETPLPQIQAVNCIVKDFYEQNSFEHLEELFPLPTDINEHYTVFATLNQIKDATLIQAFIQSSWFNQYCSYFGNGKVFLELVEQEHLALATASLYLSSDSEDVRDSINYYDTQILIERLSKALNDEYKDVAQPIIDALSDYIEEHATDIFNSGHQNVLQAWNDCYFNYLRIDELNGGLDTILFDLPSVDDLKIIDFFMNNRDSLYECDPYQGDKILELAVSNDKLELFDDLMSDIDDKNIQTSLEGVVEALEKAFKKGYLKEENKLAKALSLASRYGLTEVIRTLVSSPHKSTLTQEEKFNAVYAAIKYGHEQAAQVLLESDLLDDTQITPLIEESFHQFSNIDKAEKDDSSDETEKLGFLKDSDTICTSSYSFSNDPFNKHYLFASTLMTILLSVSRTDSIDFSCIAASQLGGALMVLAWHGKLACIKALVSSHDFMGEISPEGFGFAIVRAAEENHFNVVQYLMKSCTFLSKIPSELGLALDLAALYGHEDIVRFFITSPYFHLIPLENLSIHHIAAVGNALVLEMFVSRPRCEEIELENFMQAIISSARNSHLKCLKILLSSPRFIELAHDEEDTTLELVASTVMSALNFCIWNQDFLTLIKSLDVYEKLLYSLPKLVCEGHTNIVRHQISNCTYMDGAEYCEAVSEAIRKKQFGILENLTASHHFDALSEAALLSFVPLLPACKTEASTTIETMSRLALGKHSTRLMQAMLDADILSLNTACHASNMLQMMMNHSSYGPIILNSLNLAELAQKGEVTTLKSLLESPLIHYCPITTLHTVFNAARNKTYEKHEKVSAIISQSLRFQEILRYDKEQAENPSKRAKLESE